MGKNTIKILNLILRNDVSTSEISKHYKNNKNFQKIHELTNKKKQKSIFNDQSLPMSFCNKDDFYEKIKEGLKKNEFNLIDISEEEYPPLLKEIYFSPPILFVKGRKEFLRKKLNIAIVGTRDCSKYGKDTARFFSKELSRMGFTIVSGMAIGIDRIAHETAINEAGGSIGVLGTGIDIIYPPENNDIFSKIIDNGCIITEFFPTIKPLKQNFPARNRIISGLCIGVIVIEAGLKSGAIITAETAIREDREVFAVPGNIFSQKSLGCHRLIQSGAKLIYSVDDILIELKNHIDEYSDEIVKVNSLKEGKDFILPKLYSCKEIDENKISIQDEDIKKVLNNISYIEKSFEEILKDTELDKKRLLRIISFLQLNDLIIEKSFNNYVLNK